MVISVNKRIQKPIGIFGGTFDPVHFGHLRLALELKQFLGLAEVRLIPCHVPPHREAPIATPEQRLTMLKAALGNQSELTIDERELKRDGFSYMFDTLTSLRSEQCSTPLCLIIGSDAFIGLPQWHRWQELVELCHIIVMPRPGWKLIEKSPLNEWVDSRQADSPAALSHLLAGLIFFHEVTQLDISATKIRDLIKKGKSPRFLLPDSVLAVINEQGIYEGGLRKF
ncbi:MAG: nicotinate-nucleotide adenylyltransferase [Gammaproteobacteria bacterium]|nr:nicotinate-nucleotide adenylyltransferase [Gammaproteobacteria bacterium]